MSETPTPSGNGAAPDDLAPFSALEHELRLIIRRASSAGATIARRVHPELESSAYPLLARIAQHPGTRGSDLAAHFGVGRATMSRQLSRLADLGLVERDTDPEDSRGQRITLTADGASRFEKARANRIEMFAGALAHWDREDVQHLADLLHRYSEDLVTWQSRHR
ncbi:MarR family winged helix-turn-helix transcriptional regulator [Myceligenerans indicum]|uniref:Winged helix-turn-helix transcriptional regulator n=1 Tax=Myceligenerans indicum TaxID=2593663 RepID=A0ABS1LNS5_9MICO|nr:MarR family winged helix-turn-helix transcriptional regulator [Myceligenerans indicum]MBL0887910.1 winged helix-turn-helix transcriptional regulator [Myceligenerans indicum]